MTLDPWTLVLVALCLMVVIEGLIYAALPNFMRRVIVEVLTMSEAKVRAAGLIAAAAGLLGLWILLG